MAGSVFSLVTGNRPGRSVFDLSHEVKLTCDMGQLIPVLVDEVVPGDKWEIGNEIVVRFQPLVAPILHEINAFVHYFFVPYRLLWPKVDETGDDWESFITGGDDGQNAAVLPRWNPAAVTIGSMWDYLGFPVGVTPTGALPLAFPLRAYNLVYNEYYRDQTQIAPVSLDSETLKLRAWEKDYFTSAMPWQQRGISPSLPVTGSAVFTKTTAPTTPGNMRYETAGANPFRAYDTATEDTLNANVVQLTTFDVADMRLAFQVQRWLELNARAGSRYTEFLRAHYGCAPKDERLQRPEFLGGSRSPVIVSEVLQTGETGTTPQGNMAGHGLVADANMCASYRAEEFGCIIGILSVMPRPVYQQGIDRQWLRTSRYDFYAPEFAHLSEQAVIRAEIYANGVSADNNTVFGYAGRYDEMRVKNSRLAGQMRTSLDYWHLSRQFAAAPVLNQAFIECVPRKDIFAVPSEPGLIINVRNKIRAVRPLPITSEPGLLDHV